MLLVRLVVDDEHPVGVLKEQLVGPCWGLGVVVSDGARHGLVSYTVWESLLLVGGGVPWGWVRDRGVVGWLLVENCTVDASILFSVG